MRTGSILALAIAGSLVTAAAMGGAAAQQQGQQITEPQQGQAQQGAQAATDQGQQQPAGQAQEGAQQPASSPQGQPAQPGAAAETGLSDQDRSFVKTAATGNMLEIKLGKLASEKAASPEVRQFGQKMVEDHGKAAEQFKKIAQQLGLKPPQELPGKQQNLVDAMADLTPEQFDRQYMWNMLAAHTVAVHVFDNEAEDGSNPMLVQFAQKLLPKLQEHRELANAIWDAMD